MHGELLPIDRFFRRGIELTTEIRERVTRARGWYLGQTTKLPRQMLSALFDPATTPITPYFTATLQLLHQHPAELTRLTPDCA